MAVASSSSLPLAGLERELNRTAFPYRLLAAGALSAWLGSSVPFTEEDAADSLDPVAHGWLG